MIYDKKSCPQFKFKLSKARRKCYHTPKEVSFGWGYPRWRTGRKLSRPFVFRFLVDTYEFRYSLHVKLPFTYLPI